MKAFHIVERGESEAPEKREILSRVKAELEEAKLDDVPATLAVIGVESLHIIRDLYGPELRDQILRRISTLLEGVAHRGSTLGWIEEMRIVLLFTHCDLEHATSLCELLISRARELQLRAGKHRLKLAPNIGLAHIQHASDYSFPTLVQVANEGVEVASSSGGGCVIHTELYEIVQPNAEPRKKRPKVVPAPPEEPTFTVTQTSPTATGSQSKAKAPESDVAVEPPLPRLVDVSRETGRSHDELLEKVLRELFAAHANRAGNSTDLREQVIAAVRTWSEESRIKLVRKLETHNELELGLLRRRLAKLTVRVEENERELQAARAEAGQHGAIGGIESAFRGVQGISSDDEYYKLKSGLMQQILEANLALMAHLS